MPRSSKHKSSKHSSRDAKEYSDSEKDSSLKDRKGKDESVAKVSKDSTSSEKRKLDSKDVKDMHGSGNGEYSDEYASSKRRKERSNDGAGDRWNGGEDDRGEGSKKSKTLSDSKSRKRDETVGGYGEGEEVKKSSNKGEGKHKDSGRKESREGGTEKERKLKEGSRNERSVDNEEQRVSKQVFENTDSRALDDLQSPELDNQLERRIRKKRDDFGDADKHQDDIGDGYDRRLSSRDDVAKDVKHKDEKRKDEKYRDKYREDMDRESKHRHDKQRDERHAKEYTSNRSDDKHAREEKDSLESRQKRTKLPESDRDRDHNRDPDGDRDRERNLERDRDYDLDKDRDYDRDRDWDWDNDQDHDRDRDRDRDRDHDHHRDRDGSHLDDRSVRSKESGGKKRSLDDRDDYSDTKSRIVKSHYSDVEKRTLSSSRADSDADKGRSQTRQAHTESTGTSHKQRSSPSSNTHIGKDEYRNVNSEDLKYRDSMIEQRTKGLRDGFSGMSERGTKYKSVEKTIKIDDGPVGDLSIERSSSSKASPMGLVERSPSSTSIDRRYVNKSGVRRSLEIEGGRRNSIDARDFSASEDRLGRELMLEKPLLDEPSQADSSFYGRTCQGNASLIPPPHAFRPGLDRPFMGSLEEDVRDNSNARFRRSSDPGFGRGHGNSWRGVPNWTSPVPNGFVHFQPSPAHGGFQGMMPQFTSQPLFGVRPPMEVNHAGISYHIPDADRFPGHLRPLGWQNMMDSTGPSHLHGWDGNNSLFRDDPHMYGGSDWDRNRHSTNGRGWESGSETWKEQNGDVKKDLPSPAYKDESVPAQVDDDVLTEQATKMSCDETNRGNFHEKAPEAKLSSFSSPAKVPLNSLSTTMPEKVPDTSTPRDNAYLFRRFYLSKLDISAELAHPELYDECMSLLNVEKNVGIDADGSTDLFLKNGLRTRYASNLSRHPPFPTIDTSIFQRAMDSYKKQRVELSNGRKVDIISASNQVCLDESAPVPSVVSMQVSVSTSDSKANMPMLEQKKAEILSPADNLVECVQTHSQKGQDNMHTHSVKLVMSGSFSGHENPGEPLSGLSETEVEVNPEQQVNSGDAVENHATEVENESQLPPTLHKGGDKISSKPKNTGFTHCADEKLGFGDTLGGPLIFEDGSAKACDTLMPGSNESESLILSRIHHSPESTH